VRRPNEPGGQQCCIHVHHQDPTHPARELDRRSSDGINVRLLWHPSQDRVSVAVIDTKTGDDFELPVRDGEHALDVFHHPYAYAARHGIATSADLARRVPIVASRLS
jgi:hypothetical protein